ncbi:MAG TPA: DMT family transporter [Terriglobales bacterium]|nr:DMT family transporter [Terriglobales bacterium]
MSRRAWALFVLLSLVWGVPYWLIKVAVAEISVPFLVFARSAVGAAVLFPIALRDSGFTALRGHWIPVVSFALVEMIIPWGLLSHGEVRLNSSTAGLLIAVTPILTVILGKVFGSTEILGPLRRTGLALGFAGVSVLAAPELGGDLGSIAEIVLAAACYAGGSIIAVRWLKNVPVIPMTVACLAIASTCYLLPAFMTWPHSVPSTSVIAAIFGLGIVCTAVAFASFFLLIREAGAERAVLITYVAPAVAVAAGVAMLSEPFNARIALSFVLILCGSRMATGRSAPAVEPKRMTINVLRLHWRNKQTNS